MTVSRVPTCNPYKKYRVKCAPSHLTSNTSHVSWMFSQVMNENVDLNFHTWKLIPYVYSVHTRPSVGTVDYKYLISFNWSHYLKLCLCILGSQT